MKFDKPPHFSVISLLLKIFAWLIVIPGFFVGFNPRGHNSFDMAIAYVLGSLLIFALLFALANLLENSMASVDYSKQLLELQQAQLENKTPVATEKVYSVKLGERECGTFNLEQLRNLFIDGEIDENCEVHDEGDVRWHKLREHKVYCQLV